MHSHLLVSGLPRSLPSLPRSPAPPCLLCVEGRQRAAPYSSEFPPTTAPLQTLHVDVGAQPLSVERTRSTTSCWGGEFSSDLLAEFCRDEGIVKSFTLPASPQQNGIAERRIGLIMEVACTSMIHAAAPHFLWPFAVQYAAHQLNLWPRVSEPETSPTLRWTGKVGDASMFRVWGTLSLVCDAKANKLSSPTLRCVFLSFPTDAPPGQFYHPRSRRVFSSQDITFGEVLLPQGGDPAADDTAGTRHSPRLETPPGFPPRPSSPPPQPAVVDSGAKTVGAESGGAETEGVGSGGAATRGADSWGPASPSGGGALGDPTGGPGAGQPPQPGLLETLSPQAIPAWIVRRGSPGGGGYGPAGAGAAGPGVTAGAGGTGGTTGARGAAGAGGTRGAAGAGGAGATRPRGATAAGPTSPRGTVGAGGAGGAPRARGTGAGGTQGAGAAGPGGARTGGAGAAGAGGAVRAGGATGAAGRVGTGGNAGAGGAGAARAGGTTGAGGAIGAASIGGAGGTAGAGGAGAGGTGGIGGGAAAGAGGARGTTGATGTGGAGGTSGARGPSAVGGAGAGGAAGATGAGGVGTSGAGGAGAAGTALRRPFFYTQPQTSLPPPDSVLRQLLPGSPLPAPAPHTEVESLAERREPETRASTPVRAHRVARPRPPAVPGPHGMALRPSSAPQRVVLPEPPASSLPHVPDPESDLAHSASPTITRLLATVVSDSDFESTAAYALVTEQVDFAARSRLDYVTSLVIESESVCPPFVWGELALSSDVLEDTQFELECLAATLPRFASMLLCPEGDLDALDIPTSRSYAEAIAGEYSSQWQTAMDAEMASWKSTGTYVDEVPPPRANIVDGMWIFRVKRPPGSPPAFKARYVARGFSQRQGVDFFNTFSTTLKMTTLRVLLHVEAQRDYELHSLDFSIAFLQGSLHEEIWLLRPPGFTGSFPACTQWSLRRLVYGLRQAPREWHDTLRTTLAALGFAPSSADPSLFLHTNTTLPPFYVLVYVDDLVFATADTKALALVKGELQERHICTDLGELRSYLGLQITRDRARRTITLTQSHMVHQVLQLFAF
ncbi:unnamed protein product [Closterium sp. NIES-54]